MSLFLRKMIIYLFFLILSFLPLIEGELLGIGRFLLLASCLPLVIYLTCKGPAFTSNLLLFIGFLLIALLAAIFSPTFIRSFNIWILYVVYFIYFLGAGILAKENKDLFKDLLIISLIFPSLILCGLSFYLLILKESPPFSSMNLIFANFGHNHLIDFLIFSFPVSLYLFIKEKVRFKKIIFFILNLVFILGFLSSFSRGGLLMLVLIIALMEFGLWSIKQKSIFNKTLLIFLAIASLIMFLSPYLLGREKIVSINNYWLTKNLRELPVASRLEYFRQAILGLKERPLLGFGLDNFRYISTKYQSQPQMWSWYSHNHYLQMFTETGILGGIIFCLLILLLLVKCWQSTKKVSPCYEENGLEYALLIGMLVSSVHVLFDYDWQFPSVFLLFWVIAGYLITNQSNTVESKTIEKLALRDVKKVHSLTRGRVANNALLVLFLLLGSGIFIVSSLEFMANIYIYQGIQLEKANDYIKAEKWYNKGLQIWPWKIENWQTLVHLYKISNQRDKSLAVLKKLTVLEPINSQNYKLQGDIYAEKDQKQPALQYYYQASNLDPLGGVDIYFKILDILIGQKDISNQEDTINTLYKLEKAKGKQCLLKCLGFDREEKIRIWLEDVSQTKEFNKLATAKQARVYYWLGVLTTSQQNWQKDIDWLRLAIGLDKQEIYSDFLSDLLTIQKARSFYDKKDLNNAENLANQILKKEKEYSFHERFYISEAYFILGQIYFDKNDLEKSLVYLKKSLEINPWSDKVYLGLARLYEKENKLEERKKILGECVKENKWSKECQKKLV